MPYFAQKSLADRYITRFETEPEPLPGLVRMEQAGVRFPTSEDVEVPPDAFPRAARERRRVKDMPDFLNLGWWKGVCEEFKSWVEELDPGVHQFSERIAVAYKDGRPTEKAYYAIKVRRYLSGTAIPERSTPKLSNSGNPMTHRDLMRWEDHLGFDEAAVDGRHLWVDTDFYPEAWFLSDELGKRVIKAKLKKLDLTHHRLGRR